MAAIKKYNGSTFIDAAIRKYSTASEIIVPPTTIYTDGTAITSYTIKGNTVQNGTPTPSAPVPVVGVGELETTGEHTGEYKIPILTAQGSAVNYLGSVQSNRKICKLVLDGTETLSYQVQPPLFIINIPTNHFIPRVTALCTEYTYNSAQSSILANSQHGDFGLQYVNVRDEYNVWFNNSTYATNDEFKAYLAQQYANGTPVTVYYVLATATTGTVNEPLMKIGDYADSISNAVSIPTTEGANSISVDTTVQPSEFTATWTGWHDSSVKEYVGGVGNNKFDEQYPDISDTIIYKPIYVGDGNFTLSTTAPKTSDPAALLFLLSGNVSSGASSSGNGVWSGQNRTKAAVDGYVTIAYRAIRDYTPVGSQTMLNAGTTAMTYEPYEYGWV